MPTVSVIIPCFNAGQFLLETVESVFRQTFRDFEVILVDDGSTDNTRFLIESLGSRVRAAFGPNGGVATARDSGTQLSSGEFIQYLDADDLVTPDALSRRVEVLRQTNADVAYSDWQRLVRWKETFELGDVVARTIESVHQDPQIALLTNFWCPPAAILYRRRIVNKIGRWNKTLPIIQDARFLLDAALSGARFAHVPGVTAFYRIHGTSLSRRSRRAFVRDCLENATQIESVWRKQGTLTVEQVGALLDVVSHVARASFKIDRDTFYRALWLGNLLRPGWVPRGSRVYQALSSIVGCSHAENCAHIYRWIHEHLPKMQSTSLKNIRAALLTLKRIARKKSTGATCGI